MKQITNIVDLRNQLVANDRLRDLGKIDNETLKIKANVVGKIMATAKLEIEHQKLIKTNVPIPFLMNKEVTAAYELKQKTK